MVCLAVMTRSQARGSLAILLRRFSACRFGAPCLAAPDAAPRRKPNAPSPPSAAAFAATILRTGLRPTRGTGERTHTHPLLAEPWRCPP